MKTWKKALLSTAILGTAAVALAACGSSKSSDGGSKAKTDGKTVRLYVDTEQKKAYDEIVANFVKENKDVKVEVKANNSGASNAKTDIAKDPAKYGDVFQVPHDQLGDMAEKGYINEIAPKYLDVSKAENSELAFNAVNYKGKTYALPYEEQSQLIYYDKTKLTADDVKSWDTLTTKGVLGTNFAVPYNVYPIFFSAGTTLYGENGETLGDMSVDSDKGINAMKWFAEQKSNKGVMNTDNTLNQLKSGKVSAIIDGPWSSTSVKEVLGDKMAVAPYPTITIGGEEKQMQAFLGIKSIAVNSKAPDQAGAQKLAAYLTSEAAQLVLFKEQGLVPTNTKAQENADVQASDLTKTVITMAQTGHSTLMPKLAQMSIFWDKATPLINGAYTGQIKEADYKTQLATFAKDINK